MPGTGLARDDSALQRVAWSALFPALRALPGVTSPARSARTLAFALGETHPELRGGYVQIARAIAPSAASFDQGRQARLWWVCEQLTGLSARADHPI